MCIILGEEQPQQQLSSSQIPLLFAYKKTRSTSFQEYLEGYVASELGRQMKKLECEAFQQYYQNPFHDEVIIEGELLYRVYRYSSSIVTDNDDIYLTTLYTQRYGYCCAARCTKQDKARPDHCFCVCSELILSRIKRWERY